MGKWSNSRNGNLRYSVNRENNSGVYFGPTLGLSSPKNSRRACLCIDTNTYSVDCCKGHLIQQGIGNITSSRSVLGSFSSGFSSGFQITS